MKIIVTESQYNRLLKEDLPKPVKSLEDWIYSPTNYKPIKPGESWFYEPKYYCLRNHRPQLELGGESATHKFKDGVGYITYSKDGTFFLKPKPQNPDAIPYNSAFLERTGWWWCNKTTGKIDIKVDNQATENRIAVFNGEPVKIDTNLSAINKPIPQAKTMDDVKNGKGYIILKMQGEHVRELQKKLIELGYDLGPRGADGVFGGFTFGALEKFQLDNNIVPKNNVYGNFGKITYEKLSKVLQNKGLGPIKSV